MYCRAVLLFTSEFGVGFFVCQYVNLKFSRFNESVSGTRSGNSCNYSSPDLCRLRAGACREDLQSSPGSTKAKCD